MGCWEHRRRPICVFFDSIQAAFHRASFQLIHTYHRQELHILSYLDQCFTTRRSQHQQWTPSHTRVLFTQSRACPSTAKDPVTRRWPYKICLVPSSVVAGWGGSTEVGAEVCLHQDSWHSHFTCAFVIKRYSVRVSSFAAWHCSRLFFSTSCSSAICNCILVHSSSTRFLLGWTHDVLGSRHSLDHLLPSVPQVHHPGTAVDSTSASIHRYRAVSRAIIRIRLTIDYVFKLNDEIRENQ